MPAALHEPDVVADVGDMPYDEWLGLRSIGMGGSDAAPAAGLSPWTSPMQLWAEKSGIHRAPRVESRQMRWGKVLEPIIAAEYAARHPDVDVVHDTRMFRHPDMPWIVGNPDRRLGVDGVLEIKNVDVNAAPEWDDGPPLHYQLQVLHYQELMGARYGVIAALFGGNDYHEFPVERDDDAIASLLRIEDVFWNVNVLKGVEPRVIGTDSEARFLADRYPGNRGQELLLPPHVLEDLMDLRGVKEEMSALDDVRKLLENRIKAFMGDATEGLDPAIGSSHAVVTWRPQDSTRFDDKAFEERFPRTYRKFKRTSSHRTLLVKAPTPPKRKPRKKR